MQSKLDRDNFEADLWEVEQTVKEIDKIIHGDDKDFQAAIEKEKQLKQIKRTKIYRIKGNEEKRNKVKRKTKKLKIRC